MWRYLIEYDSDSIVLDANNNTAPRGWNNLGYTLKIDDYNNLNREFTEQLGFNKTSRTWIKSKIAADGLDIVITCKIQKKDTNYRWETIIDGILNLESYEEDEFFLDLNISDSSFATKLKDRSDNEIDYNSQYTIDGTIIGFTTEFFTIELTGSDNAGGFNTTNIKGVPLYEAFTKLIQKITDVSHNVLKSSICGRTDLTSNGFSENYAVDGFLSRIMVTKGLLISGIDPNVKDIKVEGKTDLVLNFERLFNAVNAIYPIGMGIENVGGTNYVVIESLSYFFQNAQYTFELGKNRVNNVRKNIIGKFFNSIIEGIFNKLNSDNSFGLTDFTAPIQYTTPLESFSGSYSLNGDININPSDIETARQNPVSGRTDNNETLDTDETIFLIDCYLDGSTIKSRDNVEGFASVSGVYGDNPLYTNLRIRPTQNIYNHGRWIKVGLQNKAGENLIIQKTENLSKVSTQLAGSGISVDDGDNIPIDDLNSEGGSVILSGYKYDFLSFLTISELQELQDNKYFYIKFWDTTNNEFAYGWLRQFSTNPVDGSNTNFEIWEAVSISSLTGGFIEFMDSSLGNIEFMDSSKGEIEFMTS